MEYLISLATTALAIVLTYVFTRKKNESDIVLNEASAQKSLAEAHKIDAEQKIMQVKLFNDLNNALSSQNEKLLESNEKLSKSHETLINQNKQLLKQVSDLGSRLQAIELKFKNSICDNAPNCKNRLIIRDGNKISKKV
jgi:hypothetical protein